jgi:nucleoside-diphosphate-sugar epimerase
MMVHVVNPLDYSNNPGASPEIIIKGTETLLKACRDNDLEKCIFTSTMETAMPKNRKKGIIEDSDWNDIKEERLNPILNAQIKAEKMIWEFRENLPVNSKLKIMTINPGMILGNISSRF